MPDAAAELVARHYSDRQGQSTQERKRSDILQLRELNNWVKSSLISQFTRPGDYVLDLACGKGGDLPKWKEAGVGFYCGVDIAVESVRKDARERYNRARYAFPAALLVADAFEAPLGRALQPHAPFDVVSCQFALHYAFSSERRARRALQNVAEALAPGGAFVGTTLDADVLVRKLRARPGMRIANQVFSCVFGPRFASKALDAGASPFGLEYRFTLADAVEDVPEYLVHRPTLVQLAREYGLHLVLWEVRGACSALCLAGLTYSSHSPLSRTSTTSCATACCATAWRRTAPSGCPAAWAACSTTLRGEHTPRSAPSHPKSGRWRISTRSSRSARRACRRRASKGHAKSGRAHSTSARCWALTRRAMWWSYGRDARARC